MDDTSSNYGNLCQVHWTNSFIEVSTILERNAREHMASLVMFTGNIPAPTEQDISRVSDDIVQEYSGCEIPQEQLEKLAAARYSYTEIQRSSDSFRVMTNEGIDADDTEDGMIPRTKNVEYTIDGTNISWGRDGMFKTTLVDGKFSTYGVECTKSGDTITWDGGSCNIVDGKFTVSYDNWLPEPDKITDLNHRVFQGFKYGDLPTTYVIGDGTTYNQRQQDTIVKFNDIVDLDKMYPEAEYYLNDSLRKWVRKIRQPTLNRQILPVYTSMEGMNKDVHDLTVQEMKSITF